MPADPDANQAALQPEDFDLKKGVELQPEDRFQAPQFNDVWAAALFAIHLVVTALYGLGGGYMYMSADENTVEMVTFDMGDAIMCGFLLFVSLCLGIMASLVFYVLTLKKPLQLIYFSYLVYFLSMMACSLLVLLSGIFTPSIILMVMGGLMTAMTLIFGTCLICFRKSAPLTAAYLKVSADILARFKSMIAVLLLGMALYIIYAAFWVSFFVLSVYYNNQVVLFIGSFWMVFSWYWTTQVIVGVVRVCVAGVVGYYYYANNDQEMEGSVSRAFRRALTSSLGSICFGTLMVALINTFVAFVGYLRVVNARRQAQNLFMIAVKCAVCCFLLCLQAFLQHVLHLMKFFNKYAFTFIAIFGLKFTDAGYATIKLLVTNGLEMILNESNMSLIISAQTLTIAAVTFLVNTGLLYCLYLVNGSLDSAVWITGEVIGLFLALGVGLIGTEIISYCLPALLICSAHEPTRMPTKAPELYEVLSKKYPGLMFLRRVNGEQI